MSYHVAHRQRFLELAPDAAPSAIMDNVAAYDVRLEPAEVAPGAAYWRVAGVYHLAPEENQGKHAVYVEVVDEQGARVRDSALRLNWGWEGQRSGDASPPKAFDKPENEPATNVDLYLGQKTWVSVDGDGLPSDRVVNLHSNHPDEPGPGDHKWNTIGHHSFYVLFQRAIKVATGEVEPVREEATANEGATANQGVPDVGPSTPVSPGDIAATNGSNAAPAAPPVQPDEAQAAGSQPDEAQAAGSQPDEAQAAGSQPDEAQPGTVPPLVPDAQQWTGTVVAPSGLYLRQGPGLGYAPLACLLDRSTLRVLGETRGWLLVESSLGLGYVAAQYVTRSEQASTQFTPDERAVLDVWTRYRDLIAQESTRLQVQPGVAVAVLITESGGAAFQGDRLVIRFENHIFYEQWGKAHPERFAQHFTFDQERSWTGHQWRADPNQPFRACHTAQHEEWAAFEFARGLDEAAALRAISMGAPQIMGFNHQALNYASPRAMFEAFQASADAQIRGMFRFIECKGVVPALQTGDYRHFARIYNGPGQAEIYAGRIRTYVDIYRRLIGGVEQSDIETEPATRGDLTEDGVQQGASTGRKLQPVRTPLDPSTTPRLPLPAVDKDLAEADPALYEAWRKHIEQGFENNQTMFEQVLRGFMNPYWTTVWMYRVLFGIGVLAFVAAVILAYVMRATPMAALGTAAVFGGLSVATFLSYFLSRPLQALEENLQFITWLGVIYNSYWSRIAYIRKQETVQEDIDAVTTDTITRLKNLIDTHAAMRAKRPGLR